MQGGKVGTGVSLFLFGAGKLYLAARTPAIRECEASSRASGGSPPPRITRALIITLSLARRYREMAGAFNQGVHYRAISEYKQATEADPESLFLPHRIGGKLYTRVNRGDDAVREAEAV